MKIKHIISILLILSLSLLLVGCTENRITKSEAKEQVNDLIEAVVSGNFDDAEALLHPSKPLNLETYFNEKEAEKSVDFQSGIEISRYTSLSSALYESEVGGGEYELEIDIVVSGIALELTVDIVRNDQGFGIYEIDIDD